MEGDRLIDQYEEEIVLLQIPQEDTRIEDVVKKFKNPNRVVNTLIVLRDKGKLFLVKGIYGMKTAMATQFMMIAGRSLQIIEEKQFTIPV